MKILQKVLFPLISIFLLYLSVELINQLIATQPEVIRFKEYVMVSFLLVLYITGIYAFIGFAYPTSRLLSKNYYKVKHERALKTIYTTLGVESYRKLLLIVFWGRKKNRVKYFNGSRKGINNFIFQSNQSEFGHMTALISLLLVSVFLLIKGHPESFVIIMVLNIIGNLYPSILQRHHRLRLKKVTAHPQFSV